MQSTPSTSPEKGQEQAATVTIQKDIPAQPFDLAKLQQEWEAVTPQLLKENNEPVLRVILEESELALRDGFTIVVKVSNKVLTDRFKAFIPPLYKHLSKRLQNEKIEFLAETAPLSGKKLKPYTAQEKFAFLAEKHPVLQELRQKLDLDFE